MISLSTALPLQAAGVCRDGRGESSGHIFLEESTALGYGFVSDVYGSRVRI